jgi:hypothetical protein
MTGRALTAVVLAGGLAAGCSLHRTVSVDNQQNVARFFEESQVATMEVLNSRVELVEGSMFGIHVGPTTDQWALEFLAPPDTVYGILQTPGFGAIEWDHIEPRTVPPWFTPTPPFSPNRGEYTVWCYHNGSGARLAYLFIEAQPRDDGRMHVFMRRR